MRKNTHKNGQIDWVQEAFTPLADKPKGWVTINDIVQQTGNNIKTVADRIRRMVNDGTLEVMDCKDNGKRAKCYRKKR